MSRENIELHERFAAALNSRENSGVGVCAVPCGRVGGPFQSLRAFAARIAALTASTDSATWTSA